MLAQSTDSGQLIASAVLKLFHAMKLQVKDLRGVGIQVQLLEGNQSITQDCRGPPTRSIKTMLLGQGLSARSSNKGLFGLHYSAFFYCIYLETRASFLQLLQTLSKIQQFVQVAHHIILLSHFQEQAKTIQSAEKHQNIPGRVSTSVLKFHLPHR